MVTCLVCGQPRWMTLRSRRTFNGQQCFELSYLGRTGGNWTDGRGDISTHDICATGHVVERLAATQPSLRTMVRLFGSVSAGKSHILKRLLNQALLPVHDSEYVPLRLRVKQYYPDELQWLLTEPYGIAADPHMAPTNTSENCRALLVRMLNAIDPGALDVLSTALDALGVPAMEDWGKELHPLVLPATVKNEGTHDVQEVLTAIGDLPGEILNQVMRSPRDAVTTPFEWQSLDGTDIIVWVVDAVIMADVRTAWRSAFDKEDADGLLLESARPTKDGTQDVGRADSAASTLSQVTQGFLQVLSMAGNPVAQNRPKFFVTLSKLDLIHGLLVKDQRSEAPYAWHFLPPAARKRMREGAASSLMAVIGSWRTETRLDPQVAPLLDYVAGNRIRARWVADAILDHFAGPGEFWKLVEDTDSDLVVQVAADPNDDAAAELSLPAPGLDDYAKRMYDGYLFQMRDLFTAVVGRGLLSAYGLNETALETLENDWRLQYFFTTAVRASDSPEDLGSDTLGRRLEDSLYVDSMGIKHLQMHLLAKALVP